MEQRTTLKKKAALELCSFVTLLLLVVACSEPDRPDRVRKGEPPDGVESFEVGGAGITGRGT